MGYIELHFNLTLQLIKRIYVMQGEQCYYVPPSHIWYIKLYPGFSNALSRDDKHVKVTYFGIKVDLADV